MGFRLNISGAETINLYEKAIETVEYSVDTPDDSNARSTDVGSSIIITGKILTFVEGSLEDEVIKMARWSLVPAELDDSYRELKIDVVTADTIVRSVTYPKAFIVEYTEEFDEESGTGKFKLHAKQKKDAVANISYSGNFPV